ncbi:MAG: DUF1844 domain-containing protein [Armatimonadota bacterium]|nr:DUF1844 domain-containing protein [Armatimonadota bacterium]
MSEERAREEGQEGGARTTEAVSMSAADLMRWCIAALASKAWQAMGLVPDPATNRIERKLDEARLAIDGVAALVEQLKPAIEERERRELENLVTNLRLNFVEQKSKETS